MPDSIGLILFVIFIVGAILLGNKLKLNSGLVAIALAFILGTIIYGVSPYTVVSLFPSKIFMVYFLATFFYGFANSNGLMTSLSNHLVYATRRRPKIMVIMLFIVTWLVSTMGAGAEATPVIMGPLLYSLAMSMGFDPIMCVIIIYASSTGTQMPWAANFNNNVAMVEEIWATHSEALAMGYINAFWQTLVSIIIFVGAFFITKSYKVKVAEDMMPPEPLTKQQRTTLIIVITVVILLMIPGVLKLVVGTTPFNHKAWSNP